MTETKKVTAWTIGAGFIRVDPSPEYRRYDDVADQVGSLEEAMRLTGYSSLAKEFDEIAGSCVEVFEHDDTRSLFVDLWSGDRGIATIHVSVDDRDAFLFTEYPRIVQRLKATHQADALERIDKAIVAFIRHGHGKATISQFGATLEEQANERERIRLHDARRQEQPRSGA